MVPEPRPPVEYATKADLRELRQEIRADIAELKASLLMWTIGIVFTALGIQTALFIFALTNYGPTAGAGS